jgi:uncharacterized protein DUF3618
MSTSAHASGSTPAPKRGSRSGGKAGRRPDDPSADPETIKADIERTREQLASTVEELTHRADIPARVHEKMDEATRAAGHKVGQVKEMVVSRAERAGEATRHGAEELKESTRHRAEQVKTAARDRTHGAVKGGRHLAEHIGVKAGDDPTAAGVRMAEPAPCRGDRASVRLAHAATATADEARRRPVSAVAVGLVVVALIWSVRRWSR